MSNELTNADTGAPRSNDSQVSHDLPRPMHFQLLITLGLVVGPVILPFILIWPDFFDWYPYGIEITVLVTIAFVVSSILSAYRKQK